MGALINARREKFAQLRASGIKVLDAYEQAGFSRHDANAHRMAKHRDIIGRIAEIHRKAADRSAITQSRVLSELAKIAFADIRQLLAWGDFSEPELSANGKRKPGKKALGRQTVRLVDSESVPDEMIGAIQSIKQTKDGIEIRLHDKRAALVAIGNHLGMFKEHGVNLTVTLGDLVDASYKIVDGTVKDVTPAPQQIPAAERLEPPEPDYPELETVSRK